MRRIGGNRRKTRSKFRKNISEKGKRNIAKYLEKYTNGDKVVLKADPGYQKGIYFRRFHGKSGIIEKKQGNCYYVSIKDGNKEKSILVHQIHLVRI